jgi:HEAT repeat protein/beta-lactamase regulating signal transducer with metallopeptidase domain
MVFLSLPIVLDAVAKASVILAATALVAASLRRASASARHLVWTLGLLSALAAPALSAALPRWELPIVRVSASVPSVDVARNATSIEQAPVVSRQAPAIKHAGSGSATPADATSQFTTANGTPISWRTVLLFAWIAGAIVILGRMLLGLAAVLWLSHRLPVVTDAAWLPQAQSLARGLGLSRVRFLRSSASTMPMAWGILRSSVLMPADADTWPAHRLRVVLLHELAHVKRRDCLTHLVAQIACAAYWFNPLAWMAARRLRTERERACDDLVLASGTRGSEYADQLLDIARVMRAGRFPAVLAGASLAMAQRSQLEGRLMAILDPSVPRRGLTRARAASAVIIFTLLIVPVASVQPWAEERPLSPLRGNGEAGAAANASTTDAAIQQAQQVQQPQRAQGPQAPIESYPGQAAADTRADAKSQDAIQGQIQGTTQGVIQGNLQRGVQGGIAGGIAGGVAGGIHGGVRGGVDDGIAGEIGSRIGSAVGSAVGGVAGGIASGVAGGIAGGVAGVAHEFAVEHSQDRNRDKDNDNKGRTRDPRTVNALMEALKDTDKDVRETAMSALVQMRDPRIFDPLVMALKDVSADVREQAAFGLGQLRDARAVEALTAAVKDQSASVREQVVFALGQLRAASAIDPLTTALHDTSGDVREQAAFALGQIRDRRAVEPLISALKDEKPDVREQAAFALGQLRDAKAVEALVIALKDTNASVREQAAFALGQIGDARAIDGLTSALKDASASVRQQAAFALGQIR